MISIIRNLHSFFEGGISNTTGRVKLQTGRIDNLTPPGDRAHPKMMMKKNFGILEFIKKM